MTIQIKAIEQLFHVVVFVFDVCKIKITIWLLFSVLKLDGRKAGLTLSLPESNLESINVILPFDSVDETLVCVTIQMKAIEQYFQVVLSVFDNFAKLYSRFFPQFCT